MKIEFIYTDQDGVDNTRVEVTCSSDFLDTVVEKFKDFLLHIGHHPENVDRVTFVEKDDLQALPQVQQLDMSKDNE